MITAIDRAGRLVIPKELRDELDLNPNTELEIMRDGMEIRIRKKVLPILTIEKRKGFMVMNFEGEMNIDPILDAVRKERTNPFL